MAEEDNGNEHVLELLLAASGKDKSPEPVCALWDIASTSPASAYFMWECKAVPLLMGAALNATGYSREVCLGAIRAIISSLVVSPGEEAHRKAGKDLCRTKELAQLCGLVALSDADTPTLCEVCRIALHCLAAGEEPCSLWLGVFCEERVLRKVVFWLQNTYDTQLIVCASKLAYALSYYDSEEGEKGEKDEEERKGSAANVLRAAGLCEAAVDVLEENLARLDPISEAVGPLLSFLLLAAEDGFTEYASERACGVLGKVKKIIHGDPEFEDDEKVLDDLLLTIAHKKK